MRRAGYDIDYPVINLFDIFEKLGVSRPLPQEVKEDEFNKLLTYQKALVMEMIFDIFMEVTREAKEQTIAWDMAASVHGCFVHNKSKHEVMAPVSTALLEGMVHIAFLKWC